MTKPKRKRRRETERATDDVEVLYVENLPSVDIPEILRVELPQDNSVVITEVSEAAAPAEVSFLLVPIKYYLYCVFKTLEL